ncbi:hypothetical protein [Pectobacterium versatile]|uniref:hypothetical protein n=1 Tax=Pectobacterium versatile TaxID=2488639 RepID=UPI001CCAFDB6|nr:hypothetical protein [Pectobacterium versatile]
MNTTTLVHDKKKDNRTVHYPVKNGIEITAEDLSELLENHITVIIFIKDGEWTPAIHAPIPSGYELAKVITINNVTSASTPPVELHVNGETILIGPNKGGFLFAYSKDDKWEIHGLDS